MRKGKLVIPLDFVPKPVDARAVAELRAQAAKGAAKVKGQAHHLAATYKNRIQQIKDKQLQESTLSDLDF